MAKFKLKVARERGVTEVQFVPEEGTAQPPSYYEHDPKRLDDFSNGATVTVADGATRERLLEAARTTSTRKKPEPQPNANQQPAPAPPPAQPVDNEPGTRQGAEPTDPTAGVEGRIMGTTSDTPKDTVEEAQPPVAQAPAAAGEGDPAVIATKKTSDKKK